MITVLLFSLVLAVSGAAATFIEEPDCSSCDYNDGIGFVKSTVICSGYYVCTVNPAGGYFYEFMCCPPDQVFDEEHLTCNTDQPTLPCELSRECCPNITTPSKTPCPYYAFPPNDHYFVMSGGEIMPCPMSEIFDNDACSCVRGPSFVPNDYCCKILHFTFNGTYDSFSCYNFAKGEPQNEPLVDDNVLCLDGTKEQSVAVPFLDNWFAWNPIGKTFTICFWLLPKFADQTAGVFSTNCDHEAEGSVAEVCLDGGKLAFKLGQTSTTTTLVIPTDEYSKICITFDNGIYNVFYNGLHMFGPLPRNPMPINSHSATSLGYAYGKSYFSGYIDDFCFWTKVIPDDEIERCFLAGRSD